MSNPLVSICCLAYNHEAYVRECIEGFLMQKTNFAFEVLIHDDASTDNTAVIIREYEAQYPQIIKPIYQTENQYSKGVGVTRVYQFPRAKGKYIAMCEGDDYWIDPLKLQKQVDFLESHPDYSFCYTQVKEVKELNNTINITNVGRPRDFDIKYLLSVGWFARTCSIVFRNSFLDLPQWSTNYPQFSDFMLQATLIISGKARFIEEVTAVYRKHEGGVTNLIGEKFLREHIRKIEFYNKLNLHFNYIYNKEICERIKKINTDIFLILLRSKQYSRSLKYFLKAKKTILLNKVVEKVWHK